MDNNRLTSELPDLAFTWGTKAEEDDGIPFDGKIKDLTAKLAEQFARSRELVETCVSLLNPGRNANECKAPLHSFPGAAI